MDQYAQNVVEYVNPAKIRRQLAYHAIQIKGPSSMEQHAYVLMELTKTLQLSTALLAISHV